MKSKKRPLPSLELLEGRWVPATVSFINGTLFISNPTVPATTGVVLTQTAANRFSVADNGHALGTYAGVGNINYTGSNASDKFTVNLGAFTYTGSLFANSGNGNDTISVTGAGGAIRGNLTLLPGLGNDFVSLNNAAGSGAFTVGGTTQVIDSGGNDTINLGNASAVSDFLGNVSLSGMNNVTLGFGQPDTFGGDLSATVAGEAVPLFFQTKTVTGPAVTINGSLQLTGGAGNDTVVDSDLAVNRDVTIDLAGAPNDPLNSNLVSTAADPATGTPATPLRVNGNFSYTGGSGVDELILSGYQVGGSMTLNLGDGNDVVDLGTIGGLLQAPTIGGDLSITGGNGNIDLNGAFFGDTEVAALVSGNFTVNLGNGNDAMTVANAPGGLFSWTSGNGNDNVTLGAAGTNGQAFNVHMQFGTGNDTLALAGGTVATPNSITGFVDMGGPPGGNAFDPTGSLVAGTWVIVGPFTLQNV
jgi:hypothetical protein